MILLSAVVAVGLLCSTSSFAAETTAFKVRLENISQGHVLKLSSGGDAPFAVSPGIWVVHTTSALIFKSGQKDRGQGLEAQAEDGNPALLAKSLEKQAGVQSLGVFTTPVGTSGPGAIGPGGAYEFVLTAPSGARLTIVAMFGQSNDLFYAPKEGGIKLFDSEGKPMQGDITKQPCCGMPARK